MVYAGAAVGRVDPEGPLSLGCNLAGACLILWSLLTQSFNLSATAMEGSWAVVSLFGLLRWAWKARRR
ncbi:hypothetical protein [Phenylobacterium sp.]|uniref:CBU_0592 family membrane protein n=1 Tax=Phenylobacterium sp. TaxID=1871053 RepID=UPI0025D1F8AB|nr:hypothetical protein [Phenylobacterium sp.]